MENPQQLSQFDLHCQLESLKTRLLDHPDKGDIQRFLEDLQRHQAELDRQLRELREARQGMEKAHEPLTDLSDCVPVGCVTLDRAGVVLNINLTGARMLGVERSEVLGRPLAAWLESSESPRLAEHLNGARGHTDSQITEVRLRPPKGDPVDVRLQSIAVTSAAGDTVFRTAMIDITDQKQVERALAYREAQYRAVLEGTSDGFWMVDEQGHILAVNDAYVRLSGYTRDELLTMRIEDLDATESPESAVAHIEKVRREGSDLFESQHRTKQGMLWPVEVNATYCCPRGDGLFFGFLRDITDRKALQMKISEVSAAAKERIGREIHDTLGQQLTGTIMLANSLARQLGRENHLAGAAAANELMEHLQQTLDDARSLASGLLQIDIGPDGLPDMLSVLVERTQRSSGISCRFDWPEPTGTLDEKVAVHLYQIAQEAVHNATKHAQAGHIEVGLHGTDHVVVLSVRDDGIGMTPQVAGQDSLGLHIMRHRARVIGATLTIGPAQEGGTLVQCICRRPVGRGSPTAP